MLFPFTYTFAIGCDAELEMKRRGITAKKIDERFFAACGKFPDSDYYISDECEIFAIKEVAGVIGVTKVTNCRISKGRNQVCLCKAYIYRDRLIYSAFVSGVYTDCVIDHKDGNKANDEISNLEIRKNVPSIDYGKWTAIYVKKYNVMARYATYIAGCNIYSHDIAQDSFFEVIAKYKSVPAEEIGNLWATTVRYKAMNARSYNVRFCGIGELGIMEEAAQGKCDAVTADDLPPENKIPRAVLALYLQGYSRKEIAKKMNKSIFAVNSAMQVAIRKIKKRK